MAGGSWWLDDLMTWFYLVVFGIWKYFCYHKILFLFPWSFWGHQVNKKPNIRLIYIYFVKIGLISTTQFLPQFDKHRDQYRNYWLMLSHTHSAIIIGSLYTVFWQSSSQQDNICLASMNIVGYFSIAFISSVPSKVTQTVAKTLAFRGGQHSLKSDLRP